MGRGSAKGASGTAQRRGGADDITPEQVQNLGAMIEARYRAQARTPEEGAAILERLWKEFNELYKEYIEKAEKIEDTGKSAMAKTRIQQRFQDQAMTLKTFRPEIVQDDWVERVVRPKCDEWLNNP